MIYLGGPSLSRERGVYREGDTHFNRNTNICRVTGWLGTSELAVTKEAGFVLIVISQLTLNLSHTQALFFESSGVASRGTTLAPFPLFLFGVCMLTFEGPFYYPHFTSALLGSTKDFLSPLYIVCVS